MGGRGDQEGLGRPCRGDSSTKGLPQSKKIADRGLHLGNRRVQGGADTADNTTGGCSNSRFL